MNLYERCLLKEANIRGARDTLAQIIVLVSRLEVAVRIEEGFTVAMENDLRAARANLGRLATNFSLASQQIADDLKELKGMGGKND